MELPVSGNVLGLGIDLVEIARIRDSHERHAERWLDRLYTEAEQAYCLDMKNPYPSLAARFAAKEAVSKAFGTGIGAEIGWKGIEVVKGELDEPLIKLDEQGQALLRARGAARVLVSLSHTRDHATAIAMLVS